MNPNLPLTDEQVIGLIARVKTLRIQDLSHYLIKHQITDCLQELVVLRQAVIGLNAECDQYAALIGVDRSNAPDVNG